MIIIKTKEYFPNAKNIKDELYCLGDINKDNKIVTIVGTRRPSEYGKYCTSKIVTGFKGMPISIVSGLAIGIDMFSHEVALSNNINTIAIPGSSLEFENVYPRRNLSLVKKILENSGAMISLWKDQPATQWTFPARNALMAAISDLVIIIESKIDSGTMITAKEAMKRGVPLAAIPGPIDSIYSAGPNKLIQSGAHCITCANDVIRILGIDENSIREDNNENKLLSIIREGKISKDSLINKCNLDASDLNIELTMLEMSGEIKIDSYGIISSL